MLAQEDSIHVGSFLKGRGRVLSLRRAWVPCNGTHEQAPLKKNSIFISEEAQLASIDIVFKVPRFGDCRLPTFPGLNAVAVAAEELEPSTILLDEGGRDGSSMSCSGEVSRIQAIDVVDL